MNLESIEKMMHRLMQPLASNDDLQGLRNDVVEVKDSVKGIGQRQDKVENDLTALREEM